MTPPTEQTNHVNSNFIHEQNALNVNDDAVLENQENIKTIVNNVIENQDNVYESSYDKERNEYFDSFPPGYKFKPDDDELIVHYLAKKISNQPLPVNKIYDVELYKKCPATLTAEYECNGNNQWYFFTPRNRKYLRGQRPNRAAGNGYWKATGADKAINFNKIRVGSKKSLAFHEGKARKGVKTQWIMHEYTVENPPKRRRTGSEDMKLDDWVLCKVYKKAGKVLKNRDHSEEKHKIDEHPLAQPQPINEQNKQTPMLPVSVPYETSSWSPVLPNHQNQEQTLMFPSHQNQEQTLMFPSHQNQEQTFTLPNQPELLANLWNQEQIVMFPHRHNILPNHVNQMDYLCSMNYDQGFHNYSQYPNVYGRRKEMAVRPIHYQSQLQPFVPIQDWFQYQQVNIHDMVKILQSNVNSDNQQQGHLRSDDQQTNVTCDNQQSQVKYENQHSQVRNDNQPAKNEYDFQGFEEYIHPGSDWKFTSPPSHYESNNIMLSFDNINDNNVDQYFDIDQNNFNQQRAPSVSKKDENF